ncbi:MULTISPECIES: holin family protein [unclassified Granulicatella]|uniref:phage holin family protein n=1 Tax=unclassified Granulicatella TaxID=2630493 RepID=UPI001073C9FD|nr:MULTISPECIES: phage holin family protein [unclassified Granulicatella]MBF0780786.1 phage holin family protein [Granulicatella sp. 19428wC4_WM01]TFU93831.1 holin [Granulicatella sp. WM01]
MKELCSTCQVVFSVIGGTLGYFLGGLDGMLYTLLVFVVIDYLTGVLCVIADKRLSSEVGFNGIARKIIIFALVGIAHLLDVQILGHVGVLRAMVIFFYVSNEGISIVENASHLGLLIPEKLKSILQQLKERGNEHE